MTTSDTSNPPQDDDQPPRPAVATALDKASVAAGVSADFLTDLAQRVRRKPLSAVVAAVAVGYLFRKVIS